jgi:hypothetical protein
MISSAGIIDQEYKKDTKIIFISFDFPHLKNYCFEFGSLPWHCQ